MATLHLYGLFYGVGALVLYTVLSVGNVLIVRVISATRRMSRNSAFDLMRLLAVFDGLSCLVFYAANAVFILLHLYGDVQVPALFCQVVGAAGFFFVEATSLGQLTVAINRLCSVFFPMSYKTMWTKRRSRVYFLLIVVVGPLINAVLKAFAVLPPMQFLPHGYCMLNLDAPVALILSAVFTAQLPAAVTISLYAAIFLRVSFTKSAASRQEVRRRARGSFAMFVNMLAFLLCTAPAPTVYTRYVLDGEVMTIDNGFMPVHVMNLFGISGGVNLFIYILLNAQFRRAFFAYMGWSKGDSRVGTSHIDTRGTTANTPADTAGG